MLASSQINLLLKTTINLCGRVVTSATPQLTFIRTKERYAYEPVIKHPHLTKPEVDLYRHDPDGTFSPKVIEFIKARDFENSKDGLAKKLKVISFHTGEVVGQVEGNGYVLGANPRIDILHQNMVWFRACIRSGTASTKTRAEVRGGGRKPWKQKGTGRARHGSIRSPIWVGGGRSHGPKPRDYSYDLPHRVRRMGLRVALSCRLAQGDLTVIEDLNPLPESTEEFMELLKQHEFSKNCHIVDAFPDSLLGDHTTKFDKVTSTHAQHLHVYGILIRKKLVLTLDALRMLEEKLCEDNRIITLPEYELHHQDMLFDKELYDHEYDPKRKMVMKRYVRPPPFPSALKNKPRGRMDLRWWHSRGYRHKGIKGGL